MFGVGLRITSDWSKVGLGLEEGRFRADRR